MDIELLLVAVVGREIRTESMTSWPETRNSLIQRLADPSDSRAWEEFETCYQPAIYRYVRSRGLQQADAMDAVQEVMLAVHKMAANWKPGKYAGSFRAWLSETARRVTLHQLRIRQRVGNGSGGTSVLHQLNELVADQNTNDEQDQLRWQFYCAASKVESQVSALHWRAFWMTAVDGRSADDVAGELKMKVGTVYSIRCRVQAKIRDQVQAMNLLDRGDT